MNRWVLHVDLDQFLAAVEILRRPELAGRPVVVGGDGDPTKRGVVSTASYEARVFGVRSGVPLRTALKRCPDAVFLPVDKPVYEAASAEVMATLRSFDGIVEVLGWDEAFVEVHTDHPLDVAEQIRRRVLDATGLRCSVGAGHTKLQAKMATGFGKPDGTFQLTADNWFELLGERPPDVLWGVGTRSVKRLQALGISTVRELAGADHRQLADAFGPTIGPWLILIARGVSDSPVSDTPWVPRSRSKEVTFQQNLREWTEVRARVPALTADLLTELDDDRPIQRVVVKLRFAPFFTSTHGHKLPEPSRDSEQVTEAALAAFERFDPRGEVRLLGVRVEFADPPTSP